MKTEDQNYDVRRTKERKAVLVCFGLLMLGLLSLLAAVSFAWIVRRPTHDGLLQAALAESRAGDYEAAEELLMQTLAIDPKSTAAHRQLAMLFSIQGRRWESLPHLLELLAAGNHSARDLFLIGNLEMTPLPGPDLQHMLDHDCVPALIAQARLLDVEQEDRARRLLERVVEQRLDLVEAQARLGLMLAASGSEKEFLAWTTVVDPQPHPDIWVAYGLFAQRLGEPRVAARCFGEAILLDPDHRVALQQLAGQLSTLGDEATARLLLERSRKNVQLLSTLDGIQQGEDALSATVQAAELTESLGRLWEARAWRREVLKLAPQDADSQEALQRLEQQLAGTPPYAPLIRAIFEWDSLGKFEWMEYPLPDWQSRGPADQVASASRSEIRFRNVAASAGLDFDYFCGVQRGDEGEGRFMFEMGGGVGALDFDIDGWPDLYFTQGAAWPPDRPSETRRDGLYWNRGGEQFEEIAARAGLGCRGFGQGLAVGDYDNDGFPDLYVANIGRNELYHNNGDGTFSRKTAEAGLGDQVWTTSTLIADLNGDALPDLYDVNYLRGERLFTRRCAGENGALRICGPVEFEAEQDQLFLNLGDGRFQRVTEQAGVVREGGNGMGVVALDVDGEGATDLFVANDMTANFLFLGQTPRGQPPKFEENAWVHGLAVDCEGTPQACMGVAAGDADGDGRVDLFVTNFSQEWYTLYRQVGPGVFADESHFSRLRRPTFETLGFGTQFLDADLDGWPDLVAANGHIDDFRFRSWRYKMPAHFYHNQGGGRFALADGDSLGFYFNQPRLGRGLAKLDWNRDGREDFAVTHLDCPAAVLQNETRQAGHYLAVRLIGVHCDRDAIAARVTLISGDWRRSRQLTAGDGYQASNERRLVFGLGERTSIDECLIRWPDGSDQKLSHPSIDQELVVVQDVRPAADNRQE